MSDIITDKSKRKEIDGKTYIFYAMKFRKSRNLLLRIIKAIAPSIGEVLGGIDLTTLILSKKIKLEELLEKDIDLNPKKIIDALISIETQEVEDILDNLLSDVIKEGSGRFGDNPTNIDIWFMKEHKHYFNVVCGAMEAEYGDFFGARAVSQENENRADMTLVK